MRYVKEKFTTSRAGKDVKRFLSNLLCYKNIIIKNIM